MFSRSVAASGIQAPTPSKVSGMANVIPSPVGSLPYEITSKARQPLRGNTFRVPPLIAQAESAMNAMPNVQEQMRIRRKFIAHLLCNITKEPIDLPHHNRIRANFRHFV